MRVEKERIERKKIREKESREGVRVDKKSD